MTDAAIAHQDMNHTPVSYSAMKKFREGGIHNYYRYKERELDEVTSDSLDLGTLIDEKLLNEAKFNDKFVIQTSSAPSSSNQIEFCEHVLNAADVTDDVLMEAYRISYANPPKTDKTLLKKAKEVYEANEAYIEEAPNLVGKKTYSEDDSFALNQIKMNIMGHKKLGPIFDAIDGNSYDGIEVMTHIKLEGMMHGLPIRGELDLAIINHTRKTVSVQDLKSTYVHLPNFKYQVRSNDYVMQQVIYEQLALQNIVPEGYELLNPKFIAVKTSGSYDVASISIPSIWMEQEKTQLKKDFELLSWHYASRKFKYDREYYEGDGTIELEFLEDLDKWKANVEHQLS